MAAASSGAKSGKGFDAVSAALLAAAALLFLCALSLFLQGGFLSAQQVDHIRKLDLSGDPQLLTHDAAQLDLLSGQPAWLDREAGTVTMPIGTAKERLVEKLGARGGTEAGHE